MKHAKKSLPEGKKPRPQREAIGRSRSFKGELAREYGVEKLPESLKLRTEKTLSTLPDVMPSKPRPVLRVFRGMATAAASLAVASALLLGLGATNPGLIESLPGLGPVFASMNRDPSPSPLPSPTPEPEFQPVTVLSKGDFPGVLTVEDAWSDGRYLFMELSISPYDDFYSICDKLGWGEEPFLHPAAAEYSDSGEVMDYNSSVTVFDDSTYHGVEGDAFPLFTSDGSGKLTARWTVELENLEPGELLKADLSIPSLTARLDGYDSGDMYSWASAFETSFTLPVDRGLNRAFSLQTSDGPVTLDSVDYSPSKVSFDVSLPYLGTVGELVPDQGAYSGWPLGMFARLTCTGPDGKEFVYALGDGSPEGIAEERQLLQTVDLRYTFTAVNAGEDMDPRGLKGPLVLTLYEYPRDYEDTPGFGGRVNAEFTIDLSTGRAYPSENYLEQGYEKGDASKTVLDRISEASTDGLLLTSGEAINTGGDPASSFTISAPSEYAGRTLTVNCLLDETVYRSFSFVLGDNYEDGADSCYTGFRYVEGREFLDTTVTVAYPEWVVQNMGYVFFDRIELAYGDTGEVIFPDMQRAWTESSYTLLGEKYYETGSEIGGSLESPPEL